MTISWTDTQVPSILPFRCFDDAIKILWTEFTWSSKKAFEDIINKLPSFLGVKLLPFVWSFSSAFNPFLKLLPSFFRGKIVAFCVKLQFSLESWGRGDMQQPERERGRERESYNERNIRIFYPYNVLQWKREKCKNISFWERELRKMSIVLSMAFVSTLLNQKWGSFDLTKGKTTLF